MIVQEMILPRTNGANGATRTADLAALTERIVALEQRIAELEESPAQDIQDRLAMVVFSGDLDKAIAAFIIATGAADTVASVINGK